VLDRYHQAAATHGLDTVVRLTADCPLLDPGVVDQVIMEFASGAYDYASNTQPPTFPDGLDTEVFNRAALERAWVEARLPSEREHVTPYIWKHPELFRLHNVRHASDLSQLRWTVDDAADLDVARAVIERLGANQTSMRDVLALIEREPRVALTNAGSTRNAGYVRSLRQDVREDKGSR
jgi:spore coat polysaccharide biosynthesis protein SpsF